MSLPEFSRARFLASRWMTTHQKWPKVQKYFTHFINMRKEFFKMRQMRNFCADVGAALVKICAKAFHFAQMTQSKGAPPNTSLQLELE